MEYIGIKLTCRPSGWFYNDIFVEKVIWTRSGEDYSWSKVI